MVIFVYGWKLCTTYCVPTYLGNEMLMVILFQIGELHCKSYLWVVLVLDVMTSMNLKGEWIYFSARYTYVPEFINIILIQELCDNFAITRVYVNAVDSHKCSVALCNWSTRNMLAIRPSIINIVINVKSIHVLQERTDIINNR